MTGGYEALANAVSAADFAEVELLHGEVVVLHPGDVAVLAFDVELSADDAQRVRSQWEQRAPGTDALVISKPATLAAVIRAADRADHDRPIL